MGDTAPTTSRRALLRALTTAPVLVPVIASPWGDALARLHDCYADAPAVLCRSREGRSLSRFRYHSAEISFMAIEAGFFSDPRFVRSLLHQAGFVCRQALCAYLLDVGFPDAWNADSIRQDNAKALAYANASGFAHDCPETSRLAAVLSPYWKWGYPRMYDDPAQDDGGFTYHQVRPLVRALLDRVHDVTGHPRPKGWRRHRREVQA
jgi:hypothetical protein